MNCRPVIDREVVKPRRIGVVRNISDLRDSVMHSNGEQAFQLCQRAAGVFAYQLAERFYLETVDAIRCELLEICKHHGPCSVKLEAGYRIDERVWEYLEEEQDERIIQGIEEAKKQDERIIQGIEEAKKQALLREAETQETDKRKFAEYARRAMCAELSPTERQHLEDAARQFEVQFAGMPVIDAEFGIKLPKRTGNPPDGK